MCHVSSERSIHVVCIQSVSFCFFLSSSPLYRYATVYEFCKNHFLNGEGETLPGSTLGMSECMCSSVCPSTRPCSGWVQRSTRNEQRGWLQHRGKTYTKETQLKLSVGFEVWRLKKPSDKRWFCCELPRRMGYRILREAWWRGLC